MKFYIITKEEIKTLIETSNDWYVNKWSRKLKSKPMVGVNIEWLEGKDQEAKASSSITYPKYKNSLKDTTLNRWDKIDNLLK